MATSGPPPLPLLHDIAEDFGQSVDLTRRIREILANYPEGTTLLKELIQNADDAGATQISFCLDRRRHGKDSLLFRGLSAFQGPALLAYNNAQFSIQDFESISKLGGSQKQGEPWKTGRFGVGFNSVYHLSDLPSFVSGSYIVFFDPHCKFLPNISAVNPGKRIDFVSADVLTHYKDQFQPYCVFGCDMKTSYNGTIFRLPLRTVSQATESQLSKQYYSEDDIMQLLDEIHLESSSCMLFLKNMEMINIYDWKPDSNSPDLKHSCSLKSANAGRKQHRDALKRLSGAWTSAWSGISSIPKHLDSFTLHFETKRYAKTAQVEVKLEAFLIVQCLEASTSKIGMMSASVAKRHGVCLLPWAAVAAKVSENNAEVEDLHFNDGRAFCFLPLPVKTNLPVHVNGFFELSSNRRDIWHGSDMEGMGKIRSDWNTLLLNDVVTSAYCHLLSSAPEVYRACYSLWPTGTFMEPWKGMVAQLYNCISEYPLLYSHLEGGKWITPSQAVIHDEDTQNAEDLASALIAVGLPIVRLPKALLDMISDNHTFRMISPSFLRQYLQKVDINCLHLTQDLGFNLLDYCLGDVIDSEASANLSELALIPLSNGRYGVFGDKSAKVSYFICSEKQHYLLDKVKSRLIERKIPPVLFQRLSQIADISSTNIKFLSNTDFLTLLVEILPVEWKGQDEVKWLPGIVEAHPREVWMATFWDYLRDSFTEFSLFDDWPIIPTIGGFMCRAKKSLGIVKSDGNLPQTLEKILVEVGCRVMRFDLQINHEFLPNCVHLPNLQGILDAISFLSVYSGHTYDKMFSNISNKQRSELRDFFLDMKWYRESHHLRENNLQVLKSLPIFELFNPSGCSDKTFVDLVSRKWFIPPSNVDESLIGEYFLYTQSNEEIEILARILNVEKMKRATFFRFRVINRIGELKSDIRNKSMTTILKELPLLCLQDSSLKDLLRDLAFIPTSNGDLQFPKNLYDPRIEEFKSLLDREESFPSEEFRSDEILDALQTLGLQTVVSPETVLRSARQVEMLQEQIPDEANIRGFLLLTYLENNAAKLFPTTIGDGINMFLKVSDFFQNQRSDTNTSKKFWNELSSICWCPVLVRPTHPGLPWPLVTTSVAPPRLVRLPSDLWLASASMRILNGDCRSTFLSQKLGWTEPLGGNIIAAQLLELGKNTMNAESKGLKQALATIIPKMYTILTEKIGTEDLVVVKTILEGCQWVWVGDRFVTVQDVVLDGPLHLAPYLWVIPADVAVFKELLVELGVKESLTIQDFVSILSKISKQKGGMPLDSHELKTTIWILQHLADSTFSGEIFLPDVRGILVSASELAYGDAPWLLGDSEPGTVSLNGVSSNLIMPKFVHANISNDVAERLGVKSLRRLLLAESADSMNMTLHGSAEAFGQHEALTTRLKHIVDMYADGPGILCELLQNSDDAGASEVSFLLDQSQYGASSILSPKMSEWQGPALYCYNNSVFSSKDLHAISRIGQDSKLEKPHSVGRFGLGFNSVYHFTDVPSFVSGDHFVIFDPHASHLPGISPSHPGLKIKFAGKGIALQFPDQFYPYFLFGCDLQHNYNGTLFRFPLRNNITAAYSQIKQTAYSPDMVLNLFENFQNIASEVLLFLHNVTCINLYFREGMDKDMKMIYRVERDGSHDQSVYKFVSGLKTQAKDKDDFYRRLQNTPDKMLPSDCQLINITRHEFEKEFSQRWMVSEYLGGKHAIEMAAKKENRTHGFVPWAGVAAKIGEEYEANMDNSLRRADVYGGKCVSLEGRAFCFLPLPVKTGLPVHVNAYFELSSNRRDIWYGDDMAGGGKLRSEWNCCLLKEVSSCAYVHLLAKMACELGPYEEYFSLWPTGSPPEPWNILLHNVYLSAVEMDIPLLYTTARGGLWISPKKAVFPDYSYLQAVELGHALADAGLTIINAPKSVVSKFEENCPSLRYMRPQMLRNSLVRRNHALNNRTTMLAALKYCLSDIEKSEAVEKLEGLPLVPLANGKFGTFSGSRTAEKIFVADEIGFKLLKDKLLDRIVDPTIELDLLRDLHDIAKIGSINIYPLSAILLKDLLPTILPSDWHGKHLVNWNAAQNVHPTREWMELLWSFFNINSADLSLFLGWPLLPTSDENHLFQLTKDSSIIVGDRWSENLVNVLQKANCFILSSSFIIEHAQLGEYVHHATASGLLETFLSAAGGLKNVPKILKDITGVEMQELRGFLLQKKWFANGCLQDVHIEILKHLSIFKSFRKSSFVNLSDDVLILPPNDVDVELLGDDFIQPDSEKEESILTEFLGVKKIGKQEYYEHFAFKNLHKIPLVVHERIVLNLIKNFPSIENEVPSLKSILSEAPIIPNADSRLKAPKDLYDPRIHELYSLLDGRFFPAQTFSEDILLDSLIQFGLKSSLGLKDLIDSANSIATVAVENEQRAFDMGKCLLAHIDKLGLEMEMKASDNTMLLDETTVTLEKDIIIDSKDSYYLENSASIDDAFIFSDNTPFWIELNGISWCPALLNAPIPELPWPKGLKQLVVPPKIVRPQSQMWHVSATMRILDGDFSSMLMMSKLGWLEKPNLSILAMQLINLSEHHALVCSKSHVTDKHTNFNQIIGNKISAIYSLIEDSLNSEDIPRLQSMLEGAPWVWVGDGFVDPKQAAFVSPSHFQPYLHMVPSELSGNRSLLLALGVRESFDVMDFVYALKRVSMDMKGQSLSNELLDFVVRLLEAIDEFLVSDKLILDENLLRTILVPDANSVLVPAKDLVYNDAPWLAKSIPGLAEMKHFVHPSVQNDLADRLGAKSLRYLSFVDKEMTKDLPCLSLNDISHIIANYGEGESVLFDILEIADKCKAHTVHVIYDKRTHPQTSILQPNLGQFQGAALTVVLEGAELTTEEVCNLQMSPSWSRRGQTSNYGGGLLSCYNIADVLFLISSGCLYLFDPSGEILAPSFSTGKDSSSMKSPKGKAYTFQGTDMPQRFADQFLPFSINQNLSWKKANTTILRMPLAIKSSSDDTKTIFRSQSSEVAVENTLKNFIQHASTALLFLNSVEAVNLLTWQANEEKSREYFSVKVDPACVVSRNPFQGKSSRKFQLSTIFNGSTNMTKINTVDIFINEEGNCIIDKWIVVLSFGCGQTKNMALDRKFLSYNLSPIAGIATHVSRNGSIPSMLIESSILCPLPLSFSSKLPVSILGCFIVSNDGFRHLFPGSPVNDLAMQGSSTSDVQEIKFLPHMAWNQELMSCVQESYIHLLCEAMFVRADSSSKSTQPFNSAIPKGTWKMLCDQFYSLWPISEKLLQTSAEESINGASDRKWLVELLIKPMFLRLAELPLWKLHGGLLAKAMEGMFLSSPRTGEKNHYPPDAVCEFLKLHYKVFAVPSQLVKELEDAGVGIQVITPSMVRNLLRMLVKAPKIPVVEGYVELLEYSCSDYESLIDAGFKGTGNSTTASLRHEGNATGSSSVHVHPRQEVKSFKEKISVGYPAATGDALDIVTNIGRTLVQLGKGVVGDLGTDASWKITESSSSGRSSEAMNFERWVLELKGLPCPTATADIVKLGKTELWVGSSEHQKLLMPLAARFIHATCLDRPVLSKVFKDHSVQQALQIKPFTSQLLSQNLSFVLPKQWLIRINSAAWIPWDNTESRNMESEWLRMFWRNVEVSDENLSFFKQWPLVPAVGYSTVLVKVQSRDLIFFPPRLAQSTHEAVAHNEAAAVEDRSYHNDDLHDMFNGYDKDFLYVQEYYPWLFPFLNQWNVPVFDQSFLDCEVVKCCLPSQGETLGELIRSKLLRAQQCGHAITPETSLRSLDCDALFSLFALEFHANSSMDAAYSTADLELLRSLPIYKTTLGSYTSIGLSSHYTVTPEAFFQPKTEWCLVFFPPQMGGTYYKVLGIPELSNIEILLQFCLPFFNSSSAQDQEHILLYIYSNWETLQHDERLITSLTMTKFVTSENGMPNTFFQPQELLDPKVPVFREVYRNKLFKFPSERFTADKWLDILRKAGLQCTLDARALLDVAKEVEEMGKESMRHANASENLTGEGNVSEDVFLTACRVVESILANFASIYGSSFFQPLSDIAFVPAEMGLPIANASTRRKVLASYKEVVLMKDWPLAWTCSPILTNNSLVPPEFSWRLLHLHSPPQFQTVLKHLEIVAHDDGEDILARWPSAHGTVTVEYAFLEVLRYLDRNWGNVSSSDKNSLQKISFIPVSNGTRLCSAKRIFVRLEMNLAPFAFQLPSSYLPFVQLLTDLGMQESPTFSRMQQLLFEMQNACGYQRLNPNELRAVFKILDFLCEIDTYKQSNHLAESSIVPDDAGRLVHAHSCVYIDGAGSRMVGKIDTSRLRFVHPLLKENNCILLGIRKLSDIVEEIVCDALPLEYTDNFGSITKSDIVERLQSSSFQLATWVLVQDFSQEMPHLNAWTRLEIEEKLRLAADHLQCVQHIYTRFILVEVNIDITKRSIGNDGNKVYEYIDKKCGKVLLAEPPDYVSGLGILSVMVSKILNSPVCLPIASLFGGPVGSEGNEVERLRIRATYPQIQRGRHEHDQGIVPGNALSTLDSSLVQVHPLRPYYAEEIVAWCVDYSPNTKMRYGIVKEDVRAPSGQALYYIQVETGPGQLQHLLSSNVFAFKNIIFGKELNSSQTKLSLASTQSDYSSLDGESSESSLNESLSGSLKRFPTNVQAAAVVQAVNDMMASVGLPMGFDQQALLNRALVLQEDLAVAHSALSLEKERADQAAKEAEAARASWICRVCLNLEVSSLLLPCGHILCQNCSSAVTRCPFCRKLVTKSVHLYRP